MTNLEYCKEFIERNSSFCQNAHILKYKKGCGLKKRCGDCEFRNVDKCLEIMLAEHKEPIKLTQTEKDLLKSFADVDEGWNSRVLNESYIIRNMRHKGYFKNVDLSMTFREVLDNCEVVE